MSGHYGARRALQAMLEQVVPQRMHLIRARFPDLKFLKDPACYELLDAIPDDDVNPRVLISSSKSDIKLATSSSPYDLRQYDYDLSVAVTVFANREIKDEEASILRDLLLLAVREAVLVKGDLGDGYTIVRTSVGDEETGHAGAEDGLGRPISLGSLSLTVRSEETVVDVAAVELTDVGVDVGTTTP